MNDTQCFLYKLMPPRPTFFAVQTEEEAAIMGRHMAYWADNLATGKVVAFGPVLDPEGVWGLGVIEVNSEFEAEQIRDADPAVTSGLAKAEIHPMPRAVVRPLPA